ncbi:CGNR zinc finger domain-containing protein [Nitratireductor sp. ZSWI3]|uniref:CGNR zinc finger domain-containing protein n=1 Tax=Nitratireductor sp. ZSWI3 TaxID=2966359 RepID=UPI0021504915|nr:CGNR zinc finger domain-containing protein [Nitratireductor sp. ZSWI3]MCR4265915.1 CGNR zinc finger domain-containing protein [Nitratireductor sp. ZSWI3]
MTSEEPLIEQHKFRESDFVGDHPALDFVNTVTGWDERPRDWIHDYAALVDWALIRGIVTGADAAHLQELAKASPRAAATALTKAKELRLAMHGLLTARVEGAAPRTDDLAVVEWMWRGFNSRCELAIDPLTGIQIRAGDTGLDVISMALTDAFIRLGEDFTSPRLKRCAGVNCGWFFFDRSKPGRRRWCDMATCGNAAKYARHRKHHSASTRAT